MGSRLSYQDFPAYQAIVYDKSALVLFMLEDLIGRPAFEAGLRTFYERHRFQAPRTGDFIKAMEAASGRDLGAFFRGWLFSWQLPEVRAGWTETAVADGVRLDIRVVQTKGLFVFPLWIEWTEGGTSRRTMIVVDEATESLTVTLPERPRRVRVDPDRALPGFVR
jgi:aminopeptidase N